MSRKFISLAEWIEEQGVIKVAKLLRCSAETVRHWRSGYCRPTGARQLLIEKLSEGRVTPAQISADYWAKKNKKNRWQSNQNTQLD